MNSIREEFFLLALLSPLVFAMVLLLSSVRAPNELFKIAAVKKRVVRPLAKIKETKEVKPKIKSLQSLSSSLSSPKSVGSDLKQLTAGVVSQGAGQGVSAIKGDQAPGGLIAASQTQDRSAQVQTALPPEYPQSAQARGIEGFVIVEVTVSEQGQVGRVSVLEGNPPGVFDDAAISAVKRWSFSPAIQKGSPVSSTIKQKVNFELQ